VDSIRMRRFLSRLVDVDRRTSDCRAEAGQFCPVVVAQRGSDDCVSRLRAGLERTGGVSLRSMRPRWATALVLAVVVLAVLAAVIPLVLASALTKVRVVGESWPLTVLTVQPAAGTSNGTVTLSAGTDADEPGQFRLSWVGGSALVGGVVRSTSRSVTRVYADQTGSALRPGLRVGVQPGRYVGTPASGVGLGYRDTAVPTGLGPMPAWFVPASPLSPVAHTWVLLIHGLGGSRQDTLAAMPLWHSLGYPQLAITYRNDAGAPRSRDHREHLGMTEWKDVDAAVGFAVSQGASRVILQGYSQGGAMALLAASSGVNRSHVVGLVLDSPVVDLPATIAGGARQRHLPGFLAAVTCTGLSWLIGDVCEGISLSRFAATLQRPALLIQGLADRIVPPAEAAEFAQRRPDLVVYLPVPGADHVSAIDTAPAQYASALAMFARGLH
jgi:pimeloyl-ACP methyl ester carboxylesterase